MYICECPSKYINKEIMQQLTLKTTLMKVLCSQITTHLSITNTYVYHVYDVVCVCVYYKTGES